MEANAAGQVFGDENRNSHYCDRESIYTVTVTYRLPEWLVSEDEAALYEPALLLPKFL